MTVSTDLIVPGIAIDLATALQGWAIPASGHQYYTQYYTAQTYVKLYNTLYQYYT